MGVPKGGIGFFDSGSGGLTVLAACQKYFHEGVFYYYGDNARAPYGNLSDDKILSYLREGFDLFSSLGVKAVVIACNTATAVAVETLRKEYPFPIVGAEPSVMLAAKLGGEILALSTRATYESQRYKKLCARARARYPQTKLFPYPCDGLAGAIERFLGGEEIDLSAYLPVATPSAVVLGCTHYVFLKKEIGERYGCPCFDGNDGIARRLVDVLRKFYGNGENFWDGRPLCDFLRIRKPPVTPIPFPRRKKVRFFSQNKPFFAQKPRFLRIFFLGSGKTKNVKIYEQMFISIKT